MKFNGKVKWIFLTKLKEIIIIPIEDDDYFAPLKEAPENCKKIIEAREITTEE